jgi:hypothetical protein
MSERARIQPLAGQPDHQIAARILVVETIILPEIIAAQAAFLTKRHVG